MLGLCLEALVCPDHALECPESQTEWLVGMSGRRAPPKKEKLPSKLCRRGEYTIIPVVLAGRGGGHRLV